MTELCAKVILLVFIIIMNSSSSSSSSSGCGGGSNLCPVHTVLKPTYQLILGCHGGIP